MPFTEYEFQGDDGNLLNPDTLHNTSTSEATENNLIGTFSDIEFESVKQIIPEGRLAANLQTILKTDVFSSNFSQDETKKIMTDLLYVGFQSKYEIVTDIGSNAESTYKNNFMNYLFKPICQYTASVLHFQTRVEEVNAIGQTGVHTRVPHQSKDLFYSYPDIVAYAKKVRNQSLALVEVKKLPILISRNMLDVTDVKMKKFIKQVVAEMFSNHTNKGMLTDSYTTILIEMDIERSLEIIEQNADWNDGKPVALNYRVLDCHSSGLTLRGGLISYIYEAFAVSEDRLDEIKRGLDTIYKFIRKTDEEYLTYLDEIALKHEMPFRDYCINSIENHPVEDRRRHISATEIALGSFDKIDVQCGFTFNSQLFKVNKEDVEAFFIEPFNGDDQFIVKVFDPIKTKRDHKNYRAERTDSFNICRKTYLCEKLAYEILSKEGLFNNVYVGQKYVFGKFNIGEHYHALGPFIILKYIEPEKGKSIEPEKGEYNRLPKDRRTYEKAEEQLKIIHSCRILHGDICERNILYSQGKVYFIDFGYSDYNIVEKGSRPVTADQRSTNNEHRKLCRVFNQEIPQQYEDPNE
ncbi:unnamed protein product [Debaryomyces tyrocola]|nr:unnamed protein product [Debaryomyces tyrocola]